MTILVAGGRKRSDSLCEKTKQDDTFNGKCFAPHPQSKWEGTAFNGKVARRMGILKIPITFSPEKQLAASSLVKLADRTCLGWA
jgi:hypothetical protein